MKLFYNVKNISLNESQLPQNKVVLDEIDELSNTIESNINKDIQIPNDVLNSFKIKDSLNQEIWKDDKLLEKVRLKLIKIAEDFYKDLEIPTEVPIKDIIFTGSLANFNWSKFSDIDLHIVIDFSEFDADNKMVEDFFYAQKAIWNQEHDITVFGYPIELYVQDVNHELVATAVYSVLKDKWILKPKREDFQVDKGAIKNKADKIIHQLKDIRDAYKNNEYKSVVDKVKSLKEKIKNMRNAGLEHGGEFSLENLVFKVLRRTSFMDQLDSFKAKSYDKLMSVTEMLKENIMKDLIRQRLHEAAEKPTRFIPYDDKAELKQHSYSSLSKGVSPSQLQNIKGKITQAAKMIGKYREEYNDGYMGSPIEGNGFYQLEIKHDGRLLVKQIKASGDMDQQQGPMTDVGTCKTFQNIARYCMVKAGNSNLPNNAYGKSPADDAANKALVIFQKEIMDFLVSGDYTSDEKGAEISAQNMTKKAAATKAKKDLEAKMGGPISDMEWNQYRDNGIMPAPRPKKAPLSVQPSQPSGEELRAARLAAQAEKRAKRQ
jgi:hypothetical protein